MALKLPENPDSRKAFLASHIFHERQMNSCPIGCAGCAVSASTNAKGSMKFSDLLYLYDEALKLGVSLSITKVEGYDPVFVNYADNSDTAFAESVVAAVDRGHKIITPVCTTGSWRSERTKWQLAELGELSDKYRQYHYPSGKSAAAFVLSVPREIKPFTANKYNMAEHLEKVLLDVNLLSKNGNLDVLIYYNSNIERDLDFAEHLKASVEKYLSASAKSKTNLLVTNFNEETLPESCYRYPNSILVSSEGLAELDTVTMDWQDGAKFAGNEALSLSYAHQSS
jgi:hypothetical protein